jgi:hypothetical protein
MIVDYYYIELWTLNNPRLISKQTELFKNENKIWKSLCITDLIINRIFDGCIWLRSGDQKRRAFPGRALGYGDHEIG